MSRPHRLTGAEFRVWRQNVPQLVNEHGHAVRALLLAEEQLVSQLSERARRSAQAISEQAEVLDADGQTRAVRVDIQVQEAPERTPAGPQHQNPVLLDVRVDGLERKTARQLIGERLLAHYGVDVMVRSPNGKFLRMVRHPMQPKPVAHDANRTAPKPEFCDCKVWGRPHPGRHHPVCPHNKNAAPEEQALSELDIETSPIVEHMQSEQPAGQISETKLAEAPRQPQSQGIVSDMVVHSPGIATAEKAAPEPSECQCKDWARPTGADPEAHHPICEFRLLYEKQQAQKQEREKPTPWLITLDGERIREASPEEIELAYDAMVKTGLPSVLVDNHTYAVDLGSAEELKRSLRSLAGAQSPAPHGPSSKPYRGAPSTEPPPVADLQTPMQASAKSAGTESADNEQTQASTESANRESADIVNEQDVPLVMAELDASEAAADGSNDVQSPTQTSAQSESAEPAGENDLQPQTQASAESAEEER